VRLDEKVQRRHIKAYEYQRSKRRGGQGRPAKKQARRPSRRGASEKPASPKGSCKGCQIALKWPLAAFELIPDFLEGRFLWIQ